MYQLKIQFYTQLRNGAETDTSEIRQVFKQLYPNRTATDNDVSLTADAFANMYMEFTDDLQELRIFIVKGEQRIELHKFAYTLKESTPFQYRNQSPQALGTEGWGKVPYNPAQPLQVKIGDYCPETGYWSCAYLSSADGLFMRAGDRMPGQSAVARGDIPADTLWTLIKLGAWSRVYLAKEVIYYEIGGGNIDPWNSLRYLSNEVSQHVLNHAPKKGARQGVRAPAFKMKYNTDSDCDYSRRIYRNFIHYSSDDSVASGLTARLLDIRPNQPRIGADGRPYRRIFKG